MNRRSLLRAGGGLSLAAAASAPGHAQHGPDLQFQEIVAPDGVPLNLVRTGKDGPLALLLLHGFTQSYMSFLPQLSEASLAAAGPVAALDLRGHGASGKPWESAYYTESKRWADDIATALSVLGAERAVLVGWSFGGYCALDYLRFHGAERIAALVLVGSHGGLLPRLPAANGQPSNDLEAAMRGAHAFMSLMSATPPTEEVAARGVAANLMLPPYVRRAMHGRNLDNRDLAERLPPRTVFVLGDRDPIAAPDSLAGLKRVAPKATHSLYEACGHSPFIEAPARFNRELLALMR